jgi:hypothetical protein
MSFVLNFHERWTQRDDSKQATSLTAAVTVVKDTLYMQLHFLMH